MFRSKLDRKSVEKYLRACLLNRPAAYMNPDVFGIPLDEPATRDELLSVWGPYGVKSHPDDRFWKFALPIGRKVARQVAYEIVSSERHNILHSDRIVSHGFDALWRRGCHERFSRDAGGFLRHHLAPMAGLPDRLPDTWDDETRLLFTDRPDRPMKALELAISIALDYRTEGFFAGRGERGLLQCFARLDERDREAAGSALLTLLNSAVGVTGDSSGENHGAGEVRVLNRMIDAGLLTYSKRQRAQLEGWSLPGRYLHAQKLASRGFEPAADRLGHWLVPLKRSYEYPEPIVKAWVNAVRRVFATAYWGSFARTATILGQRPDTVSLWCAAEHYRSHRDGAAFERHLRKRDLQTATVNAEEIREFVASGKASKLLQTLRKSDQALAQIAATA